MSASTITTTREIDLSALAAELGGATLTMVDTAGQRTITCPNGAVTGAALQAAVDAHVPPPPPPSLQEQIDDLADFIAINF